MKKFLATILTLTLFATVLFVTPASAATSFDSNMTGWTGLRGTWDFATGDVTSSNGNNYACPVETTVKKGDNWSWSVDVKTENTAPNFQFQFGRATAAFTNVAMFYVQTTADAKARLFYNDGSAATNYTRWLDFPSGSVCNDFNIKIVMLNGRCYVYIDNNCVITHDMSETPYNGGYFGIYNSKVAANYNNINLYVNNEAISVISGYYLPSENGFATANSVQKWNQAYVGDTAVGKYLTIETDYKCLSGNNQSYIRFGLIDDSNYFSVNMQPNDTNGNHFAIYELVAGQNNRRSAWVSGPSGFDPDDFKVKFVLTPADCELYINGIRILTTTINYTPGRFGLATLYTSAQFNNFEITKSHGKNTAFTPVTNAVAIESGMRFTSSANWNKANLGVATNGDFEISANMKSIEGNNQLFLYFGASSTSFTDGYSVRIQSVDGVSQAVVYSNSTNKRVSAWCDFPEGSNISDFEIKLKYINKVAIVYIDGVHICVSVPITTDGAYTSFHTYKTVAEVTDVTSCIPQAMPYDVSRDDAVNSDDLSVLRKVLLGVSVAYDAAMTDCNGDGATDVADLVRLKKYAAALISIVDSNAIAIESETAENYAYLADGSFNIKNAQADFDSEKPYVYFNQIGTVSGNFASLIASMGVYVTNNYTIDEIGVIAAEGDYTENKSALVADSADIAVTKSVLGNTDSYSQYKLYVTDLPSNTSRTIRAYIKLTDNEGNTSYVYSNNCCFFRGSRAVIDAEQSARQTALSVKNTAAVKKTVAVSTTTVHNPEVGASYAHHPHITFFKGKFYSIFSIGEKNEEDIGQSMAVSVSEDAVNWSDYEVIAEGNKATYTVVVPGGLYSTDERLIAYYATFDYSETCVDTSSGIAVRPTVENAVRTNWKMFMAVTKDGVNWSHRQLNCGVACNFAPKQTKSGRLIMCGANVNPITDDITGLSGWKDVTVSIDEALADGAKIITESGFYQTDDGVLHMLFRSNSEVIYYSESYDDGASWTRPYATSFKSDSSKFAVGRLANGMYYWIGNTSINNARTPLTLFTSSDGVNFDKEYVIKTGSYTHQFDGLYKAGAYSYPSTFVKDGELYIIYSVGKEKIEISKISIADLS